MRLPARLPLPPVPPQLRLVDPDAEPHVAEAMSARAFAMAIGAAILFGAIVRASFVLAADFPLNDGGMFYAMVRDLQSNRYALPDVTSYDAANIPYAYPPLGFYLAGLLDAATPMNLFTVFRVLPLAVSILTIPAFFLLARDMLVRRVPVAIATFSFAFIPNSFAWTIMGGGLTRSFGLLFTILALDALYRAYTRAQWRWVVPAGICCALAALSHLETAWFLAFSAALFAVVFGRNRFGFALTACVAAASLALTSPWWATVIAQHGPAPFVAAMRTGATSRANPVLIFIAFNPTNEPLFAIIAAAALLGSVRSIARGEYLLPAWVLLAGLLDPRSFGRVASPQIAMLAGIAIADVIIPMLRPASSYQAGGGTPQRHRPVTMRLLGVLGVMCIYALVSALVSDPQNLAALTARDRAPMAWVARNTPPGSQFLVVTDDSWADDRTSEWFNVLSQRVSVATPQGYEWLPDGSFAHQLEAYRSAQRCARKDGDCLDSWSNDTGKTFDYVYIPKLAPHTNGFIDDPRECCPALIAALGRDARYALVYDGIGAIVFKRLG